MPFTQIAGHRVEYERIAGAAPPLVLLHEGLGSIAMWKEFPPELAAATGHEVVSYSRYGYGRSERLAAPRAVRYLHEEALHALPQLLDGLAIERPVLLGHSDGASIAIIFAGARLRALSGLVLLAPHVMVEELSVASIAAAKLAYETGDLRERLARYHQDVDSVFRSWNDIWLHPDFRHWNIEEYLAGIDCPVLVIQGREDEYGTMAQVERIARGAVRARVEVLELADCRHSAHRDQPGQVLAAVTRFMATICRTSAVSDPGRPVRT